MELACLPGIGRFWVCSPEEPCEPNEQGMEREFFNTKKEQSIYALGTKYLCLISIENYLTLKRNKLSMLGGFSIISPTQEAE